MRWLLRRQRGGQREKGGECCLPVDDASWEAPLLAELTKDIKAYIKVLSKPSLLQRLRPRRAAAAKRMRGGQRRHELQG